MLQASEAGRQPDTSNSEPAPEVRLQLDVREGDDEDPAPDPPPSRPSPHAILASSLRAHTARLVRFIPFSWLLIVHLRDTLLSTDILFSIEGCQGARRI